MENNTAGQLQLTPHEKAAVDVSAMHDTMSGAVGHMQRTTAGKTLATSSGMQEATIAYLSPTSYEKILEARIYRKWVSVSYQKNEKKTENGFCCILIDRQGNAIQENMNVRDIDYFNQRMNLGSVYRISEFMCEPTETYQQTIDNRTSLRFGRITKFEPVTVSDIPQHYFNFVSYKQLQSRLPREDGTGKTQYLILTDYIVCLASVSQVKRKEGANEDETIYRKVDIENLNGNVVEFTMWDEMATNFGQARLETMEQPIIIAVTSCRVSKYRDYYQLTATSATYYYLNPHIPEADESRAQ